MKIDLFSAVHQPWMVRKPDPDNASPETPALHFPQHVQDRAQHKANVKGQRRAANRVARHSRRVNRHQSR
jgi:hypothetical protein